MDGFRPESFDPNSTEVRKSPVTKIIGVEDDHADLVREHLDQLSSIDHGSEGVFEHTQELDNVIRTTAGFMEKFVRDFGVVPITITPRMVNLIDLETVPEEFRDQQKKKARRPDRLLEYPASSDRNIWKLRAGKEGGLFSKACT